MNPLTYEAKWKSQFDSLFDDDFSVCDKIELGRLDQIHTRLSSSRKLNTSQTTLLSRLVKRMEKTK
jgi:hypothetical protein